MTDRRDPSGRNERTTNGADRDETPFDADQLLEGQVYVLGGFAWDDPDGDELGQEGNLTLVAWGQDDGEEVVPVFTSAELLEEVAPDQPYLGIAARDFFEMTRGADLVLDPGGENARDLPAELVEKLLDDETDEGEPLPS